MSDAAIISIPTRRGYPQRELEKEPWLDVAGRRLSGVVRRAVPGAKSSLRRFVREVRAREAGLDALSEAEFDAHIDACRTELETCGMTREAVAQALACTVEASARTLGKRHFDVQVMGAWVMLSGNVAEMATGEGKTLTAALAASVAGLAGTPVHVVTVNDYLVTRDAEELGPLYRRLGLSVGTIVGDLSPADRTRAYAADVTYCSNKELVFDYLKDRIALADDPGSAQLQVRSLAQGTPVHRGLLMRGLHFAIIDEIDSVLVDEARVPLIISRTIENAEQTGLYHQATALAARLVRDEDYLVDEASRQVLLTEQGRARMLGDDAGDGTAVASIWRLKHWREQTVLQALVAKELYVRDRHYLVRDDKIEIVDEFTGRTMPDRSWELGLHQLIEVKEGVTVTGEREPLAKISYQRFFARYLKLAGMSGTVQEIAPELWTVYRLHTVRIPTNRPCRRQLLPQRVFARADDKWAALVERVRELNAAGRPILVGTRSVADSEVVSAALDAAGIDHRVLNARQDAEEAEIVAAAGGVGQVTVATNMAGRGTDIVPSAAAREQGGLHVIATERHEAGRIDRQLIGRTGRQGDPGSAEFFVSLDDELIATQCPKPLRLAARSSGAATAGWLFGYTQKRVERIHARTRDDLRNVDEQRSNMLAFAGIQE